MTGSRSPRTYQKGRVERRGATAQELVRLVKFGMVGGLNTLVDYGVWAVLYYLARAPLLLAQTAGYGAGVANSYVLNSLWTFGQMKLGSRERIVKFLVVNAVSYGASLGFIAIFAVFLPPWLAKVLTMGATFAMNFMGSRLWVFRQDGRTTIFPRRR